MININYYNISSFFFKSLGIYFVLIFICFLIGILFYQFIFEKFTTVFVTVPILFFLIFNVFSFIYYNEKEILELKKEYKFNSYFKLSKNIRIIKKKIKNEALNSNEEKREINKILTKFYINKNLSQNEVEKEIIKSLTN